MFMNLTGYEALLTFDEAVERHSMVRERLVRLTHEVHRNPSFQERAKLILAHFTDAWNESVGAGDPDSKMAAAVRMTFPIEHIPLLRMRSCIPAAVYCCAIFDFMIGRTDDLEDFGVLTKIAEDAFNAFDYRRQQTEALSEGFGFDRSDAWLYQVQIADRSGQVDGTMQQIARLAGRMFRAFEYEGIPTKTDEEQQVEGIETGGRLDRMLDDEAASAGVDPEAMIRIAEDRAFQYSMSGERLQGRGPLVIAEDESGSMHNHRAVWAKACMIALTRIALAEGRKVMVVHFSTVTDISEIKAGDNVALLDLAKSHLSGGTCIETALHASMKQVARLEQDGHEGADIVFITDGCDQYSEDHFKEMKRRGIRLWTVAIDVSIRAVAGAYRQNMGSGASPHLYTYADAYVELDDATIRNAGDAAINAAVQLKQAAYDNVGDQ